MRACHFSNKNLVLLARQLQPKLDWILGPFFTDWRVSRVGVLLYLLHSLLMPALLGYLLWHVYTKKAQKELVECVLKRNNGFAWSSILICIYKPSNNLFKICTIEALKRFYATIDFHLYGWFYYNKLIGVAIYTFYDISNFTNKTSYQKGSI